MAGKLIKRSKKWSFKYYDNGKELRYTCNATAFEDAKDEQSIFMTNLKNSNSYKPEMILLAPFVKKYLEVSKTDKAKRTYLSARTLLNHFLKNIPETIKYLDEITFDILQEYKTKEKERGQSINSVNSKIMKIKALFNYAIEDKKLKENPAKRLKYIKQGRKIPHFLSIDEINKYKNADTNRNIYYLANLVALYTGFRSEEIYYLTKKDIDMNNKRISVNPKKNWQPKTYEARTNPMSNNLMIIIKEIYALIGNSEWLNNRLYRK